MCINPERDLIIIDSRTRERPGAPMAYVSYSHKLSCIITISLSLSTEHSSRIIDSCNFIEWISCQRSYIDRYEVKNVFRQKQKSVILLQLRTTLHDSFAWDLAHYLSLCCDNREFGSSAKVYELVHRMGSRQSNVEEVSIATQKTLNIHYNSFFFKDKSLKKEKTLNSFFTGRRFTPESRIFDVDFENNEDRLLHGTILSVPKSSFFLYKPDYLFKFDESVLFQFCPALNSFVIDTA